MRNRIVARRKDITPRSVLRVLAIGFLLVILLLVIAGAASFQSTRYIRQSVEEIVEQEMVAIRLLDDVQREQAALTAVFYKLSRDPAQVHRDRVLSELDAADQRLAEISGTIEGEQQEKLWRELRASSEAFSTEARSLLMVERPTSLLSRELFRRHQESLSLVSQLAAASHTKASEARAQLDRRVTELTRYSAILLGACILLALACAILTVRMALALLRRMESQSTELSRVSWQMLENQEIAARRFSHELHDELGQSLTAIKANLAAMSQHPDALDRRVADCTALVDAAIQNVREMSQLLHPTMLDDFGLDAAVRSLAEGFTERTGIEVRYESNHKERLPIEVERHLFRISQEALTNVARHARATAVHIELNSGKDRVRFTISDNGRGLPETGPQSAGLGLVGMRARARSAGGRLSLRSTASGGLAIEVEVPVHGREQAVVATAAEPAHSGS